MYNLSVCLSCLQGMNFIAGYLLITTKDEEKSFWLLEALLGRILPGVYFNLLVCVKAKHNSLALFVLSPVRLCSVVSCTYSNTGLSV